MKINRLFEIVYLLIDKKRVTADELATHFEVSKRTILRDIDTLTTAGIPLYTTQGKGGGISIHDNFVLNKTFISAVEQKQILFALQSMAVTELVESDEILGKLQSFFASSNKDWIEVDFSRWEHSAADNAKFEMLKEAIINERALTFDYLSAFGQFKARKVYPLKLVFKSKTWYLQSFCLTEQQYIMFNFTRISKMAILDESFDSHQYHAPKIEEIEHTQSKNYTPIEVKVRIAPTAKFRVYDEFPENDITVNADGTFTLRMSQGQWIHDYILSYGDFIEVVEPESLRTELLQRVEKIKNKYLSKHDT